MKRICGIYKITNPIGFVYVGQSVNIWARYSQYKCLHNKQQRLIHQSILDYGFDNHKFEIIEETTKENLNERERHWQEHYMELGISLNIDLQGTPTKKAVRPDYIREICRKKMLGHKINVGRKKNPIGVEKSRLWHLGSKRTEESKEKMRESASYKSKAVVQYDLNMNKIAEFRSSHEASRITGVCRVGINRGCKNNNKNYTGFYWRYKD